LFLDSSPLSGRSLDWKAKMLKVDILFVVGAQPGAKSGGGSRDLLDARFFRGFTRVRWPFLANGKEILDFLLKRRNLN
jgi:hypothetical protein